jgi:hypothetical protein
MRTWSCNLKEAHAWHVHLATRVREKLRRTAFCRVSRSSFASTLATRLIKSLTGKHFFKILKNINLKQIKNKIIFLKNTFKYKNYHTLQHCKLSSIVFFLFLRGVSCSYKKCVSPFIFTVEKCFYIKKSIFFCFKSMFFLF